MKKVGELMDWISIEYFITNGIFAALFVWLLHTTNKRNEAREEAYRECMREYRNIIVFMIENQTKMPTDIAEIE